MRYLRGEFVMEEMIEKLKVWVKETYSPEACGATSERSAGNYNDCFNDGYRII